MNVVAVIRNAAAHGISQRDRDELIAASDAVSKLIDVLTELSKEGAGEAVTEELVSTAISARSQALREWWSNAAGGATDTEARFGMRAALTAAFTAHHSALRAALKAVQP